MESTKAATVSTLSPFLSSGSSKQMVYKQVCVEASCRKWLDAVARKISLD